MSGLWPTTARRIRRCGRIWAAAPAAARVLAEAVVAAPRVLVVVAAKAGAVARKPLPSSSFKTTRSDIMATGIGKGQNEQLDEAGAEEKEPVAWCDRGVVRRVCVHSLAGPASRRAGLAGSA